MFFKIGFVYTRKDFYTWKYFPQIFEIFVGNLWNVCNFLSTKDKLLKFRVVEDTYGLFHSGSKQRRNV